MGKDAWFFAEYEEKSVRTQVSGLREGDEVDAGIRQMQLALIGFMTSMFGSWF